LVDIFDEVSDDLRAERAARLLRRYGALLILAALLVLIAVGAQQAWQYYAAQQAQKAATAYLALTTAIDADTSATKSQTESQALALQNFAATAPAGYRTLAELRAAALYAGDGSLPQAAAAWQQVSSDPHADPLFRDLATLLWCQHELGVAPDEAVFARLQPLEVPENPYHALAQETQALLYLSQGKTAQAKALFSQIASDPNATGGVRNRADGMLAKLNG